MTQDLTTFRWRGHNEQSLQDALAAVLPHLREYALSPEDRVDFFLDGEALEVKVSGSVSQVLRQLHRYAQHEAVTSLILVTTRMVHRNLPSIIHGKPLTIIYLPQL